MADAETKLDGIKVAAIVLRDPAEIRLLAGVAVNGQNERHVGWYTKSPRGEPLSP